MKSATNAGCDRIGTSVPVHRDAATTRRQYRTGPKVRAVKRGKIRERGSGRRHRFDMRKGDQASAAGRYTSACLAGLSAHSTAASSRGTPLTLVSPFRLSTVTWVSYQVSR